MSAYSFHFVSRLCTWNWCPIKPLMHLLLETLYWPSCKQSTIWSDHGSNFVEATRHIKELIQFLQQQKVNGTISEFCSCQNIDWVFIPEHATHFGGLWEATVKSLKMHLSKVADNVKLSFDQLTTVLSQ